MSPEPLIAIVIPAYKPDFLDATLRSIASQQPGGFRVYVGDDASPADLQRICQPYTSQLDLRFTRFDSNLGQQSLVAHWNRSVRLSTEPWVWLFSDDDIMEPGCVQRVLDAIRSEGDQFDLFHFNVTAIDAQGAVLRQEPEFPPVIAAEQFAAARLRFELASYAPDYVFSRAAFERIGGYVPFPLAWCSDDATWISLAGKRGIRTLDGPKVHWRLSGQNISSSSPKLVSRKFDAMVGYLVWLHEHFPSRAREAGDASQIDLMRHTPSWLYRQMAILGVRFWPGRVWQVAWRLRHLPHHGFFRDLFRTIQFDARRARRRGPG